MSFHLFQFRDDGIEMTGVDGIQAIKAMAPISYLTRTFTQTKLQTLASDMPADSIIVRTSVIASLLK